MTARAVLEALSEEKARAYTTVLSVLQMMEKKGLVTHTRLGMAHVYKPMVTQRQVFRPLLRGWVERLFGGSTSAAVQQLLKETDVSDEELTQIQAVLRDHQKSRQGK